MKKKIFPIIGVAAVGAAAAFTTSIGLGNSAKMDVALSDIEVSARNENGIDWRCNCGLLWGTGCKSDNYGSYCAPAGTATCWIWDANCAPY